MTNIILNFEFKEHIYFWMNLLRKFGNIFCYRPIIKKVSVKAIRYSKTYYSFHKIYIEVYMAL